MLQAWRSRGVVTVAGYILGFPADTPESIERDIKTIQRELPIDVLEFFILPPLPGSADHQALDRQGVWMDADMNRYDVDHVTTSHARMSAQEWRTSTTGRGICITARSMWKRCCAAPGPAASRGDELSGQSAAITAVTDLKESIRCSAGFGEARCALRAARGLPRESPFLFYPRRVWELFSKYAALGVYYIWLERLRGRIEREVDAAACTDVALSVPTVVLRPVNP
jgi:hypothetical protein